MSFLITFLILLHFIIYNSSAIKKDWNYDTLGPDYWKVKYSKDCGVGENQSPINIVRNQVIYLSDLKNINFNKYHTPIIYEVKNSGYTSNFFQNY